MKKNQSLFIVLFVLLIFMATAKTVFCKENNINIYVNGKEVTFGNQPIIKENTVLVPLGELFKNLYFGKREINGISDKCKEKHIGEFIADVQMVPAEIVKSYDYINVSTSGNNVYFEVDKFKISFIDHLDGNSIYIKNNDYDVLINSGNDYDKKRMETFLNDNVYDNIDVIVASDFDRNNIGGMAFVLNNYRVNEVLYSKGNSDTIVYENMIDALLNKGIKNYKMSNKGTKLYKLGKDRFLEIIELDGKLICKIKQGDKQILLLNSIEKSSQYYLAENLGSAEIIQINNSEQLALPLLRKMKPESIITYQFNKFSNINTKNYIKDNSIEMVKIGRNLDYTNITTKDGKFIVLHDSYEYNNSANNKYRKIFIFIFLLLMSIAIIVLFISMYKESKIESKEDKNELYKSILSKFIDLCKFKGKKMYSVSFYIMFIIILSYGIIIEVGRQDSIATNINYLNMVGILIFLQTIYCIFIIFIISIGHGWQYISQYLYKNKEINKNGRLILGISIPIVLTTLHLIYFGTDKWQSDLQVYEKIYIFLALLLMGLNYAILFKGIILSILNTSLLGNLRTKRISRQLQKKLAGKAVKVRLQIKLSVIFTWFIIIYLNSVAFLYMISKISNNSFIETASGKAVDLFGIFYFTIITVFTIGYGDIIPVGLFARCGVVIVTLIGGFYTLLAIGQILNIEERK